MNDHDILLHLYTCFSIPKN